jgi:anti-sigma B factor antagonist
VVFVHLSGEFDITSIEAFQEEMELVRQSEPEQVVIDLQRLSFMDSTGIRMILAAQAEYDSAGGGLSIIPGPANVMRVLEIAGVDSRLNMFSENGAAVPTTPQER